MSSDYRKKCFAEHGGECVRCGTSNEVVAHHINGDRGDNRPENLAPLCESCHCVWHRREGWTDFKDFVQSVEAGAAPDHLREVDRELLNALTEGRVTPTYAAEAVDVSREYASDRLKRLTEHNHVEKVAPGLYELAEDPRDD